MYLVIKTSQEEVERRGSLFEAARGHWVLNPEHASKCSHAIITLRGDKEVKAVYDIDGWYPSTLLDDRYVFAGNENLDLESKLVGRTLNPRLTAQGRENPISYIEESKLLEA